MATGEKALLDLFYLTTGSDDPDCIRGLRLQDLDNLDSATWSRMARRFASTKIERAVSLVSRLVEEGCEIR